MAHMNESVRQTAEALHYDLSRNNLIDFIQNKLVNHVSMYQPCLNGGIIVVEYGNNRMADELLDTMSLLKFSRKTTSCCAPDNKRTYVFIDARLDEEAYCKRLCHEAAHLLLGHPLNPKTSGNNMWLEWEANVFACKLMRMCKRHQEMQTARTLLNAPHIYRLKSKAAFVTLYLCVASALRRLFSPAGREHRWLATALAACVLCWGIAAYYARPSLSVTSQLSLPLTPPALEEQETSESPQATGSTQIPHGAQPDDAGRPAGMDAGHPEEEDGNGTLPRPASPGKESPEAAAPEATQLPSAGRTSMAARAAETNPSIPEQSAEPAQPPQEPTSVASIVYAHEQETARPEPVPPYVSSGGHYYHTYSPCVLATGDAVSLTQEQIEERKLTLCRECERKSRLAGR